MPSVLWVHANPDPVASGELRRLGVPALALQGDDWFCDFVPASLVAGRTQVDIAVVALRATTALSLFGAAPDAPVVIEVDARTALSYPHAAQVLADLSNRIAGVVARGPRAAAWATEVLEGAVPVWLIPDPALRRVELAAAALEMGLPPLSDVVPDLGEDLDLWFVEPGDHIQADEVQALARTWRDDAPDRLVIAPRFYRAWVRQAGVKARSLEWSPAVLHNALARARHCTFVGAEGYSQARRRVVALRSGAPAVPPHSPAPSAFEPAQVASGWEEVLSGVAVQGRRGRTREDEPVQVLVLLDLIQDLDPVLPLIEALAARQGVMVRILLTNWVKRRSPRVVVGLAARGLAFTTVDRAAVVDGSAPPLDGVDAVVAVAESSLTAHACSHALFLRAREAGIPTFALQHGVENVGLHPIHGEADATLAADHLFVWFPPARTPETVSAALRPRLVHVGRPIPPKLDLTDISSTFAAFDSVVAVFENLHWSRYDQAWRLRFITDCTEFAQSDPTRAVILKPHHAGLWSVKNRHLIPQWPSNLVLADPTDAFWEPFTAGALVQLADAVITTPSTVALDAVQASKPVAVGGYGLELPAYAPLPLLQGRADWDAFLAQAGTIEDARRRATFLARTTAGDDPGGEAATRIVSTARDRRAARRRLAPLQGGAA